ncbi:MAG TPA: alcohol dehydrogenase catalytic domain-containing protein [Candidatus Dormibacteraeota bacterium]|nr:alcohol dehydrogenase catalytic domain-containing protein [Candidatus Dormibacteraeota bacterium]
MGTLLTTPAVVVRDVAEPVRIEEVRVDEPREGEVVVALRSVGVCHTDMSLARGVLPAPLPGIPGHEGAGVVVRTGTGVHGVQPGDRVMISSVAPCGRCVRCQRGEGVYCHREGRRQGVMPDGSARLHDAAGEPLYAGFNSGLFAGHAVVLEAALAPVPDGLDLDTASIIGCAVVTGYGAVVNTAGLRPGMSALVFGCGGVGLSAVMAARMVGGSPVVAADPNPERRAAARECGATHSIDPTADGARDELLAVSGGFGFDAVIEASGAPAAIESVFSLLDRGCTGVYVGAPPIDVELRQSVLLLAGQGKKLVGCLTGEVRPAVDLAALARLAVDGTLPLQRMITGHAPLAAVEDAFAAQARGEGIRTILHFD